MNIRIRCYVLPLFYKRKNETFFRHRRVDGNKQPTHEVIDTNHLEQYYAKHLDEIGKRNHYYNGRWYSFVELAAVWNKELAELFEQSSHETNRQASTVHR